MKQRRLAGVVGVIRSYPVPVFATLGITVGGVEALVFNQPESARLIWYATLIIGGAPVVYQTVRGMLRGRFAADIVAMLAIITAVLTDEAFAGVIIVLMQTGGEAIDDYGFRRASSSLDELLARAPKVARLRRGDEIVEVDVSAVTIGDTVLVRKGDLVPVDGSVVSEQAEIDESALTGEPLPRTKSAGAALLSGSVNVGQAFEMRAEKVSEDSQYSKIVELVRRAEAEKPPIQRLADRYAVWFTPITLGVAGFSWLITGTYDAVLAVLVVATPCPLILATPLAVLSGVNRAAKEGIVVKSGTAIEQVGRGRAVIFDKTGTLTYGTPIVENVTSFRGEADQLLLKVASIEQLSSHPVAESLVKEGRQKFQTLLAPSNFAETPGQGVEADLDGEHLVIGSQAFVERRAGLKFEKNPAWSRESLRPTGRLASFVAINGEPAGAIVFSDQVRAGVPAMMQRLRELGVERTVMLTGDNETNARVVAREAGIERVEANLLPAQKVAEVKKLSQEYGTTIMVGDGINDAPALASATVGVAMGAHGTGISAEAADIVLLVDDITKVGDAMEIGQKMIRIAKQSITFGIGVSFLMMVIASFGYIQPAEGAVMQEALDITVILNALRAR